MEEKYVALTPYEKFVFALQAKESIRQYPHRLDKFLTYLGLEGTIPERCNKLYELGLSTEELEGHIIRFIVAQKERIENKEISQGTIGNYIKAIKLFCSMNDIVINWKKISKGMPSEQDSADDRIPTQDEVRKLLEHPDRRIKPIVLTMISSGIRIGSWNHLQWKHVVPIIRNNILVAAKLIVKNTKINNRSYFTFITPEAFDSVRDWMDFRKLHGENITGESWLMRDMWQKIDRAHGHRIGLAKYPKKLGSDSIRNMIYEAWIVQGVRNKLGENIRRHDFKSTHAFRKMFETKCQNAKMNHNNIKLLMDHSLGESQNYHRPSEDELLDDYLTALDFLTVNDENKLKKKIVELTERQSDIDLMKLEHKKEMQLMELKLNKILSVIEKNPKLAKIKPNVLKNRINI